MLTTVVGNDTAPARCAVGTETQALKNKRAELMMKRRRSMSRPEKREATPGKKRQH